MLEVLTRRSRW